MNIETDQNIKDSINKFKWLIRGHEVHGLKISDSKYIDWNWINKKNYNVDEETYR